MVSRCGYIGAASDEWTGALHLDEWTGALHLDEWTGALHLDAHGAGERVCNLVMQC